jgi:hypothetical protein
MYNNKSAFFAVKGALPIYDRTRKEALFPVPEIL